MAGLERAGHSEPDPLSETQRGRCAESLDASFRVAAGTRGKAKQGSSPPKGQPQGMVVLAQRRKCWGEWVLGPPLPTPFPLRRQKKG